MTFEQALTELKRGHKVSRSSWNGEAEAVVRVTTECGEIVEQVIIVRNLDSVVDGSSYSPIPNDYFSDDWKVVE